MVHWLLTEWLARAASQQCGGEVVLLKLALVRRAITTHTATHLINNKQFGDSL
jgi:hypothetical protein